jgi:hypothetical protein
VLQRGNDNAGPRPQQARHRKRNPQEQARVTGMRRDRENDGAGPRPQQARHRERNPQEQARVTGTIRGRNDDEAGPSNEIPFVPERRIKRAYRHAPGSDVPSMPTL